MHRADTLADILLREFEYVDMHSDSDEDNALAFGVNSDFDFANTKPAEIVFLGEHTKVTSWADLLIKTITIAYDFDVERIIELASSNYSILNATRIYITNDERKLRKARQINNSGIYFETNLSANGIVSFIKDLLMQMKLESR